MQPVKNVKKEKKYLMTLLKMNQKALITEEIKVIEKELRKSLEISIPPQDFSQINDFYSREFLKILKTLSI